MFRKVFIMSLYFFNLFSAQRQETSPRVVQEKFGSYASVVSDFEKECKDLISKLKGLQEIAKILSAWKKILNLSEKASVDEIKIAVGRAFSDGDLISLFMEYMDWKRLINDLHHMGKIWDNLSAAPVYSEFKLTKSASAPFLEELEKYQLILLKKAKIMKKFTKEPADENLKRAYKDLDGYVGKNGKDVTDKIGKLINTETMPVKIFRALVKELNDLTINIYNEAPEFEKYLLDIINRQSLRETA